MAISISRATWLMALALFTANVMAAEVQELPPVEIRGSYDNSVGTWDAASQGAINREIIEKRPLLRPAELLETVPGLIVTQHSGDGKANQYFLRGYNLDHATDFATWLAGMPVNMPTHAHGQGYTDLNFMIPELVSRVLYTKGPYFAEDGDFASAGTARTLGLQIRRDRLGPVALYNTQARQFLSVTREDRVTVASMAPYFSNTVVWTDWLRSIAGVRADFYDFNVSSNNTANSGKAHDSMLSPKLSLILGPWAKTEYFINYGRGFHSNDALKVVIKSLA